MRVTFSLFIAAAEPAGTAERVASTKQAAAPEPVAEPAAKPAATAKLAAYTEPAAAAEPVFMRVLVRQLYIKIP